MKIIIIRHAEPDYEHDSLTEKGMREATLLSTYLKDHYPSIDHFYVSPLGRAKKTFEMASANNYKETPLTFCPWLVEFQGKLRRKEKDNSFWSCWDLLPSVVEEEQILYSNNWRDAKIVNETGATVLDEYDKVIKEFDDILAFHGYLRNGFSYKVNDSNHKTIALFCHFGVASVLMSHLMNCSPYSIWQNIVLLPSSVTEFVSEEREEGIASFRANKIGSLAHLEKKNEPESFFARFCECYKDDTRHN